MTIGSENVGTGKSERFGGKYRGSRRDSVLTEVPPEGDDDGQGVGPALELAEPPSAPLSLPSLGPDPLVEPTFPSAAGWPQAASASMVDHPLLRGLLLELPPKGNAPGAEWLDRWFEATRSILELLYVQPGRRPEGPESCRSASLTCPDAPVPCRARRRRAIRGGRAGARGGAAFRCAAVSSARQYVEIGMTRWR